MEQTKFTITKRIAKHGKQAIIVIPTHLRDKLQPSAIVEVTFTLIKEAEVR